MKIRAEKKEVIYAYVVYNGWDYRVYPDGTVMKWEVSDYNVNGGYAPMSDCEDGYNEIKAAGLEVLQ